MINEITLNFDTVLKFDISEPQAPEIRSKVLHHPDQGFVTLERYYDAGFVYVTAENEGDHAGTINGTPVPEIAFDRTVHLDTELNVAGNTWEVWYIGNALDRSEDIELEGISSNEIPQPILDMLA